VRLALPVVCLCLLAGCATGGLYRSPAGPYPVARADGLVLRDPAAPRAVPFRVAYPDGPGPFPVVVFSHGAFCYPQLYAAITDTWVAHGYVVVLPDHPDSLNAQPPLRPDQMGNLTGTRVADLTALLENLDGVAALAGISGRLDGTRVAVAGHSYGTVIAMAKAGLRLRSPDGAPQRFLDPRIRGAVLLSGVGQMDELMAPDAFRGLALPLIATGGTLDLGNTGGSVIHPWEWRMSPYTLAPPGDKYSVVLERGDHYLGGLMCRTDRGGEPDPEGAAIDAALTLAFLDAYVTQDARAARFLATADLAALTAGRARLDRK
jgi:pimeloyl-ACP methyl ester carboxylesterase